MNMLKVVLIGIGFIVGVVMLKQIFFTNEASKTSVESLPEKSFLIFGHRGACGYEPENTLSSFQKALELGVDGVELDVYVCKTGELVLMHDEEVDRTTNGHGKVVDMTFKQLQKLVVDGKERIPTLSEVIDLIDRQVPINIEIKGPRTAQPVADLLATYFDKGWESKDFVISSFDHPQLVEFKKFCPNVKIGALFLWWNMPKDEIKVAQELGADFIGLDAKAVSYDIVNRLHDAGFLVFVWTVNDKQTADKMRAMKVNGIFSNYPDRVR